MKNLLLHFNYKGKLYFQYKMNDRHTVLLREKLRENG